MMAICAIAVALMLFGGGSASAQTTQNEPDALARPGVSPGEIQRLFGAYVILQAQQELQLTDVQYPKFVQNMKALLDTRRKAQVERQRLLADIRRLSRVGGGSRAADDADLAARVKELEALRERTQAETQRALDEIDQGLDVRQRARFRVFEEQMERRKMELLMRARRNRR